jgi:CheY-like chemotaxis protein
VRPLLEDVVGAGERAADLTRQMLAYSGKGKFNIQAVNLSKLARDVMSLVQSSIPKTVEMTLDLAQGLPPVTADVAQMQQLVMNMVINAAEAIGDSPGAVKITTGVQEVDAQHTGGGQTSPGKYVFLEVQDNGCGMDEATIAKIFDPFFTTKFTGRGLGLSAALGIARGHKGYIHVESSPGRGTTVGVLLPAARETAQPTEASEVTQELARSGLILVVDDEEIVRRTAAQALEFRGYRVLEASNGSEAIELFRRHCREIALVILDLTMPIMSGEESLRRLKDIDPNVRVLLSSGFSEADAMRRYRGRGIAGFLQKPYAMGHLAERVKSVFTGSPQTGKSHSF